MLRVSESPTRSVWTCVSRGSSATAESARFVSSVSLWSTTTSSNCGCWFASTLSTACPISSGRLRVQMTALTRGVVAAIPRTLGTSGLLLVEGWSSSARRFRVSVTRHEWAYARSYRSNAERLRDLPRWLYRYNHRRPHGGGGAVPAWRL